MNPFYVIFIILIVIILTISIYYYYQYYSFPKHFDSPDTYISIDDLNSIKENVKNDEAFILMGNGALYRIKNLQKDGFIKVLTNNRFFKRYNENGLYVMKSGCGSAAREIDIAIPFDSPIYRLGFKSDKFGMNFSQISKKPEMLNCYQIIDERNNIFNSSKGGLKQKKINKKIDEIHVFLGGS